MNTLAHAYNAYNVNELFSGAIESPEHRAIFTAWNAQIETHLNGKFLLPKMRKAMRNDSAKLFEIARLKSAAAEKPHLFVKLFKWHLRGKTQLLNMIEQGDHHIVLLRDPLSVYISMVIARHLSQWHHVDTSSIKPNITAQRFLEWFAWASDGYSYTARRIRNMGFTPHFFDYNLLTSTDSQEAKHDVMLQFAESILGPRHNTTPFKSRFTKQDTRVDVREKISNWSEFSEAVQEKTDMCPTQLRFVDSAGKHFLLQAFLRARPEKSNGLTYPFRR